MTRSATPSNQTQTVELFVSKGFNGLELHSVVQVLAKANDLLRHDLFTWRYASDTPGLVTSDQDTMLRAEPSVTDYRLPDMMVVIGGANAGSGAWLPRARIMQRQRRGVVLLSDAATGYIRATRRPAGRVTTHWRDVNMLSESGHHPKLTTHLSENSDGIITAAGSGSTMELIIGLISAHLSSPQVADLGTHLLLQTLRKSDAEQPKGIADNEGLFDARLTEAIRLMEATIQDPMSIDDLTDRLGVSTRQFERLFRSVFDDTPSRFYKRLRVKRARAMIEESLMPMVDIAVATGFGSSSTLTKAVKDEYGITPSKMRDRKSLALLSYAGRKGAG